MGSNYPTGILPYPVTPILDGDTIWDYHIYQLYDDVSGIEATLGTGVQGSYATLRERIEAITVGSNFVSKAGDIMSGNLNFNGSNPVISGKDNLTFVAWGSDGELVFRAGGSEFSTISMYVNDNTVVTYSSGLVNNQVIQRTKGVYPSADGIYDLGTDTKHYKTLWVDAISGMTLGDVVGPSSVEDNTLVRFDNTTGKLIQSSAITIGDGPTPFMRASGNFSIQAKDADLTLESYQNSAPYNSSLIRLLRDQGIVYILSNSGIQVESVIFPTTSGTLSVGTPALPFASGYFNTINGTAINRVKYMEQPSGVVNGVNAVFTLSNSPYDNSLLLYKNGLLMIPSGVSDVTYDFVLSGNTVTYVAAPPSGTLHIAARYEY